MHNDASPNAIVVLGYGIKSDGTLPQHMVDRLHIVSDIYTHSPENNKPLIATLGKWSFWNRKKTPPSTTEAQSMKNYLVGLGIAENKILTEEQSEDTVGNAFFFKKIAQEIGIKSFTVVCADYHKERAEHIFSKVFGDEYTIVFQETPGPFQGDELQRQKEIQRSFFAEQDQLINKLLQHPELVERMYELPYYTDQLDHEPNETGKVALGEMHRIFSRA